MVGGVVTVSWKSRCPLKWSRKKKIDIDKVLHSVHKGKSGKYKHIPTMFTGNNLPLIGAECSPDGTREHVYNVYEDKRCKITMKFNILGDPRPKSLPVLVKTAKEDSDKIKSTRTRLGSCITYLEGILPFGELVKGVRSFNQVFRSYLSPPPRSTPPLALPLGYYLQQLGYVGQGPHWDIRWCPS